MLKLQNRQLVQQIEVMACLFHACLGGENPPKLKIPSQTAAI